jgi:hydrophobe/amphiphile efflux-1 (HAE1) family protein
MSFSTWSIRNPVPTLLLFILLTLAGGFGLHTLSIKEFPDMDFPTVLVSASLEGTAPAQLETEVARKIENKLAALGGIEHIATTITDGTVAISVTFPVEKDTEEALSEVRGAVDGVRNELPQEMAAPVITKVTSSGQPLLTWTIESSRYDEGELSWLVDNEIARAIQGVGGVAKVERLGGVVREVHVDLDPALMAGLGVTAKQVSSQLKAVQQAASGGRADIGGAQQSLRTLGSVASAEEIGAIALPLGDGRRLRLDQVARVSDTIAERTTLAAIDGRRIIGVQVTPTRGASQVTVAAAVKAKMKELAAAHPQVTLREAIDTSDHIAENYRGSMQLLIEGALLAVVVVWWFLRDLRATLVATTALPLSIIPTFAAMYFAGFSLNVLTLLALALVVGVLVDDAIVEIENIVRHLRMGKSPLEAAKEAADEIGLAVVATSLTLVAVFLPTAFMGGIPGKFFREFGVTAAVAVLASLLVARMLTPMMAAYFMRPHDTGHGESALMDRYLGWVRTCLANRRNTVLAAVALLLVSLLAVPFLPTGFVPAADNGRTSVTVELAPGSTLEETARTAEQARLLLAAVPDVKQVFTVAGSATSGDMHEAVVSTDVRKATLNLTLTPRPDRDRTQSEVEAAIREALRGLPGARVSVGGGGNGESLQLTLAGEDGASLAAAAAAVEQELRALPGVGNVLSSAALQQPEVTFTPDYERAAAYGITTESLAETLRLATAGDFSNHLSKLNLPERQVPIRVRIDPATRADRESLGQLRVTGARGTVPLTAVAAIGLASGPAEISRMDRERSVTLSVELNGRSLGEVAREAQALPAMRALPPGVREVAEGELEHMHEVFSSFGIAMAIGVFCIYAVLVLLFHDFLQPVTILAALPLSVAGALFALTVTHSSFSMPSVIGLLMLMGIVTKNSILLVEYTVMARRDHGLGRFDALVDACRKRARPIVMTTLAMTFGMLPIALGLGADPSFRQPMAIVVIGGLLASTLLSLLVVPVIFTYLDDLLVWGRSRLAAGDLSVAPQLR